MPERPLVHYHETPPAPPLRLFVQAYWTFRAAPHLDAPYEHRVLPDGCANVVWMHAPGSGAFSFYAAPSARAFPVTIAPGAVYRGVRLRPGTAGPLLHLPDAARHAPFVPLTQAAPALAAALEERLHAGQPDADATHALDEVMGVLAAGAGEIDAAVADAVARIEATNGAVQVEALASDAYLSTRQFQRRFRAATGLTPKGFARIRRFREAIGNVLRADPEAWGRVAAEHNFADQAHLIREFHALYGDAPGDFARIIRTIEHGWVRP